MADDDEMRRFLEENARAKPAPGVSADPPADVATKACKECTAPIPVAATRCMHCGVAQNRTRNPLAVVGSVVVIVVALFVILGAYNQWQKSRERETQARMECVTDSINGAGRGLPARDC